jgi:hypothetical protein
MKERGDVNAGTLSLRMRDLEINRIMAEGRMTRFGNQEDPKEKGLNPKTPK